MIKPENERRVVAFFVIALIAVGLMLIGGYQEKNSLNRDHPIITADETIQSAGIIQSSQKPKRPALVRWFSRNWLSFATLVILILTWIAYLHANKLNRDALMASHTPWIYIHTVQISKSEDWIILQFSIKNPSDSPASALRINISPADPKVGAFILDLHPGAVEIPAQLDSKVIVNLKKNDGSTQSLYDSIVIGTTQLVFEATCGDVFGRTVVHTETRQFGTNTSDPTDIKNFMISSSTVIK